MRVDLFVANGKVFVQEYTTNHMNGLRHCAAKFNPDTGCIDSCFLGRAWKAAGLPYGGVTTAVPSALNGFYALTPKQQCDLLVGVLLQLTFLPAEETLRSRHSSTKECK
jgi:hypothetical protein